MVDTIIFNVNIVTFDDKQPFLPATSIYIENNRISDIGDYRSLSNQYPKTRRINAHDGYLTPGMINAHTHLYSSFARGLPLSAEMNNFSSILKNLWWKLDKALDEEACYYSALVGIITSLKHGTTTIFDHHSSPNFVNNSLNTIMRAFNNLGMRGVLSYEVSDRNGKENTAASIKENARFLDFIEKEKPVRLNGLFGLHASFTLSDKTLDKCAEEGLDRNSGFHVHLAEDKIDVDDSFKKYAKPLYERFHERGMLNEKSLMAHGVHLDEKGFNLLADNKTFLAHNPQSNMNNAVGVLPLDLIHDKNLRLCIGTDGMTGDVREEMRTAPLLHSSQKHQPGFGYQYIKQCILQNQAILASSFFHPGLGIIKTNYLADFIIVNYHPPTVIDETNVYEHFLSGISRTPVDFIMVDGRIIMKDGHLVGIDEERIFQRSRELANQVWKRFSSI